MIKALPKAEKNTLALANYWWWENPFTYERILTFFADYQVSV